MRKIILDDGIEKIVLDMYLSGKNITQIVNTLNLSRRVIERYIVNNGHSIKTKSDIILDSIPGLSDKDLLQRMYHEEMLSLDEIAARMGTNSQVIKTTFKKLNIKSIDGNLKRVLKKNKECGASSEEIVNMYNGGAPITRIADKFNCSSTHIETIIKHSGVYKRSNTDVVNSRIVPKEKKTSSKVARNLRSRLSIAIKNGQKGGSAVRDLGCSIEEFKNYLESLFYTNGNSIMTWDNYGAVWEIDHIQPLSIFDLTNRDQLLLACHYTNMRPLFREHNRRASNMLINKDIFKNKVKMYIISGPSGCGKSYVCNHFANRDDVFYLAYDLVPKEQHLLLMSVAASENKTIIYDPLRKPFTLCKRYKDFFDIQVVIINESANTVVQRLLSRGSVRTNKVDFFCKKFNRYAKRASFSGTSDEVLSYLVKEVN